MTILAWTVPDGLAIKRLNSGQGLYLTPFLHVDTPIKYLDFEIFVKKQETHCTTRIMFRNVPLNVPDEEILNLCVFYGQPTGVVKREGCTNPNDKGKVGSNRSVDIILNDGASFVNFIGLKVHFLQTKGEGSL